MKRKLSWLFSLLLASFFAVPAFAQCRNQQDRTCSSLQYILYASETDFRELRDSTPLKPSDRKIKPPNPDLSVASIHVPCHPDFWLTNEVPVYMCSAEVAAQEAEEWFAVTMANLHELQYLWQFQSKSAGADHYVDAGPQGCEPPQIETTIYGGFHVDQPYIAEGPYLGQCPLHLQTVRQANGSARISFWLNSSLNLARNPTPASKTLDLSASAKPKASQQATAAAPASLPAPVTSMSVTSAPATPGPVTPALAARVPAPTENSHAETAMENSRARTSARHDDCDDLCQGLKKVLENRASSFRQLSAKRANSVPSKTASLEDPVKLYGAESCSINVEPSANARSLAKSEPSSSGHFFPVSAKDARVASSRTPGRRSTQYVCYWPQDSEAAAESEFHDLAGLLRILIPSSWSAQQRSDADELSGARMTIWSAGDSRNRAAIRMYLSGRSVGLHISSAE
jgi:hypothetical protein